MENILVIDGGTRRNMNTAAFWESARAAGRRMAEKALF